MMHTLRPFGANERFKINFAIERKPEGFDLRFALLGRGAADIAALRLPKLLDADARLRRDELWSSTCFEIFYGPSHQAAYFEMNMSPSGDWNVYAFDDYRAGMRRHEDAAVLIDTCETSSAGDHVTWHARVIDPLVAAQPSLVLGATAVIEYMNGEREYWALAHAGAKPDFHLRESFRVFV